MNSRERVIAALERREPDRVPFFECVIDERVMDALLPGCDYDQFNDWIGLDNASQNRSSWSRDNVEFIDEEKGLFRDKWGVIRAFGPESTPAPVEGPIKTPEDLKEYTPPDPHADDVLGTIPDLVARYRGKKAVTAICRDAYFNPAFLRGTEQFLMDMVENPKLVHELIEVCLSYDIPAMQRMVAAGMDVVVFGDDYADKNATLMSPKHFKQFILPGLKRCVDAAHEAGAYVVKHTDGNIMGVIDMIVGTGVDALNPLEPQAGMDVGLVKERYGDRIAIIGNIDCGYLLSQAPAEEVREVTRRTIQIAAPGGGYLLSSSNSIHSSVKPENLMAMVETLREEGQYPIGGDS
ncbi:MAG: uroporphyrinogen decarboxylase family protein [Planctomycetota bacterium]|jgi:uroporphyrinogen decarboxylase